ncbi:MAG: PhzF family phenazine biosynthesis protein [bacterium]|nr:PhzF family phenazine biosynthesis protein [bacterium]
MELEIFQVDAFSNRVFGGNPAAVVPLTEWLDDALMQDIAAENNLSETAFFVPESGGYELRWFTPATEVDLCGHATLASAYVVKEFLDRGTGEVRFRSPRSGALVVTFDRKHIVLDFPSRPGTPATPPAGLVDALAAGGGARPTAILSAPYWLAVFESERDVVALTPDFATLAAMDVALIATAPGDAVDFVSRFFAPAYGIDEDPVTGSAHCTLTPYWAERLGKRKLTARQVSKRGGDLECELHGDRTWIRGSAALYLRGTIRV